MTESTKAADFAPAAISRQSLRWKRAPVQVSKQFLLVKVPTADSSFSDWRGHRNGRLRCCGVDAVLQYLLNSLRVKLEGAFVPRHSKKIRAAFCDQI